MGSTTEHNSCQNRIYLKPRAIGDMNGSRWPISYMSGCYTQELGDQILISSSAWDLQIPISHIRKAPQALVYGLREKG